MVKVEKVFDVSSFLFFSVKTGVRVSGRAGYFEPHIVALRPVIFSNLLLSTFT